MVRTVRIFPPIGAAHSLTFTEQAVDPELPVWIADITSILGYFGTSQKQCNLLSTLFRRDCCAIPSGCSSPPTDGELGLLLEDIGQLETRVQYAPLSFEQIRTEIWQERPVYARFENTAYRYDLVIVGFDGTETLYVYDAANGTFAVSYKDFLQYHIAGQTGTYHWTKSIYCFRRLN